MSHILAIDPGNLHSGWCLIESWTRRPIAFDKIGNNALLDRIWHGEFDACERVGIEMVASYGMAVGASVFETCVWVGRFYEAFSSQTGTAPDLFKRLPVKMHHCHSPKANDATVRQALVDRFAPDRPNHGKGTKADPGWFHGFKADVWQAYALAVYIADGGQ